MAKFMDLFNKDDAALAAKCIDYYDGDSKEYLCRFLEMHRKNSLKKGMVPRARNLVKPIVDKSGMLFNGKPPTLNAYVGDNVSEVDSAKVQAAFESSNWIEFFTNFDSMLRMLKTVYVLVQVDPVGKRFALEMIDQSIGAVKVSIFGEVQVLMYKIGKIDKDTLYRVYTPESIFELRVTPSGEETVVPGSTIPNPFGIVPAAAFHDTNVPRRGAWNPVPSELVEINDIYNLHITDSEYSAMWVKMPTLFTNAKIQGGSGQTMESVQYGDEKLPRWVPSSDPGFVGGPGTVVAVETDGDNVYLDYKGPTPNLTSLDEMVKQWVNDFASDWSVTISEEGNGSADSGFKLVVKELPNLELRKKRQKMMTAGFYRLFQVMKVVAAPAGITFSPEAELFVEFSDPELPVDEKASEEVWSLRISEKRASRVDYFMKVQGLSQAEAEAKVQEVDTYAQPAPPTAPTV